MHSINKKELYWYKLLKFFEVIIVNKFVGVISCLAVDNVKNPKIPSVIGHVRVTDHK